LYVDIGKNMYRYDIHHKEWQIDKVNINSLDVKYKIGNINLSAEDLSLAHFSEGVKVIAWKRQSCK